MCRVAFLFSFSSLSGAFSGLLAFAISYMSGREGLLGWSWIFVSALPYVRHSVSHSIVGQIIEGMLTVVVGAISFFSACAIGDRRLRRRAYCSAIVSYSPRRLSAHGCVPHTGGACVRRPPQECVRLCLEGAVLLICELAEYDNSSVGEEEHFEVRHIWETLLDWQVWAHILIYMSIIAPREYCLFSVYTRSAGAEA